MALNEFLDEHPDNAEALLLRAQVYFGREKLELAAQDVARAETLDPDLDEFYFASTRIAIANREYDRALDLADEAFDRSDGRIRLYGTFPFFLISQRFEGDFSDPKWEALEIRIDERWLAKAPDDARARQSMARHLLNPDKPDSARAYELAAQLVGEDPEDPDRHELLGDAALKAGRLDVAEAAWVKAIELGTEPKTLRRDIFDWAKRKTGGRMLAWFDGSAAQRFTGVFLYSLLIVILVALIPRLGRQVPWTLALPLGAVLLLVLWIPATRPLAILKVCHHPVFSVLVSSAEVLLAVMVLGLILMLLGYVVAFPLSREPVSLGLLAAMGPPILGIVVIDLIRDLYDETPLKLRGPGGIVAVCFFGSIALLLVPFLN